MRLYRPFWLIPSNAHTVFNSSFSASRNLFSFGSFPCCFLPFSFLSLSFYTTALSSSFSLLFLCVCVSVGVCGCLIFCNCIRVRWCMYVCECVCVCGRVCVGVWLYSEWKGVSVVLRLCSFFFSFFLPFFTFLSINFLMTFLFILISFVLIFLHSCFFSYCSSIPLPFFCLYPLTVFVCPHLLALTLSWSFSLSLTYTFRLFFLFVAPFIWFRFVLVMFF